MTRAPQSGKKLALVIGSGGIKCAAAIGLMQVLEEENIELDMVVGCSGGAVFGAAIALGYSAQQLIATQKATWTKDITSKINYKKLAGLIAPKLFKFDETFSIFDNRIMAGNIELAFGAETTFEDTKIPFHVVTTDFHNGKPHVISNGPLAKAVRLSAGIPIVFGADKYEGHTLIDGALSNPLPVDVAIREGANVIIAVGFETTMSESVSSVGQFASQMFYILINQLMLKKLAFYNLAHHSEILMIVPEFDTRIGVSDVHLVPHIVERGAGEARQHIAYLKRLLSG